MTVAYAIESGLIPADMAESFEDVITCPFCGSGLQITETLGSISCENPKCSRRRKKRGEDILANFGLKGYSYGFARDMIDFKKLKTPLALFLLTEIEFPPQWALYENDYRIKVKAILDRPVLFREVIKNLALPGLGDTALRLFKGVYHYDHYKAIVKEMGGLEQFVGRCLGFGISNDAMCYTLKTYDLELLLASTMFNLVPDNCDEVVIAITGNVSKIGKMNRKKFMEYIRDLGRPLGLTFRDCKAFDSCKYFVCDEPSNSKTYIAGLALRRLIDSEEFVNKILNGTV